ncbi:uncharacterized protein A4U43_C06F1350 [Asparagus officinalis]|uniref:Uncharacterized protein n=1 Tax=Asparagus officinalis TaxID=4686 RepID=A0A5P1EJ71_ASPOF|nr:uncharacterized protein A4U43_C06F1350 [Asparagus officinalis]
MAGRSVSLTSFLFLVWWHVIQLLSLVGVASTAAHMKSSVAAASVDSVPLFMPHFLFFDFSVHCIANRARPAGGKSRRDGGGEAGGADEVKVEYGRATTWLGAESCIESDARRHQSAARTGCDGAADDAFVAI